MTAHELSLFSKRALVVGASRGIGAAISLGLTEAGAKVALAGRSTSDLEAVRDVVAGDGPSMPVIRLDLRDEDGKIRVRASRRSYASDPTPSY